MKALPSWMPRSSDLRDADVRAQRLEPVGFGGEGVGARRRAFLPELLTLNPT